MQINWLRMLRFVMEVTVLPRIDANLIVASHPPSGQRSPSAFLSSGPGGEKKTTEAHGGQLPWHATPKLGDGMGLLLDIEGCYACWVRGLVYAHGMREVYNIGLSRDRGHKVEDK